MSAGQPYAGTTTSNSERLRRSTRALRTAARAAVPLPYSRSPLGANVERSAARAILAPAGGMSESIYFNLRTRRSFRHSDAGATACHAQSTWSIEGSLVYPPASRSDRSDRARLRSVRDVEATHSHSLLLQRLSAQPASHSKSLARRNPENAQWATRKQDTGTPPPPALSSRIRVFRVLLQMQAVSSEWHGEHRGVQPEALATPAHGHPPM